MWWVIKYNLIYSACNAFKFSIRIKIAAKTTAQFLKTLLISANFSKKSLLNESLKYILYVQEHWKTETFNSRSTNLTICIRNVADDISFNSKNCCDMFQLFNAYSKSVPEVSLNSLKESLTKEIFKQGIHPCLGIACLP